MNKREVHTLVIVVLIFLAIFIGLSTLILDRDDTISNNNDTIRTTEQKLPPRMRGR